MSFFDHKDDDDVDAADVITEENPIEGYIDLKRLQGRASRTIATLDAILRANEDGTAYGQYLERNDIDPLEAEIPDIVGYMNWLENAGHTDRDIENKLSEASAMYNVLVKMQVAPRNPVGFVLKTADFDSDPPDRPHMTIDQVGDFLEWVPDPEFRAIGTFIAKLGAHAGETVNTDLAYLHLKHPKYYELLDTLDVTLHEEVADHADAVYIPSDITSGQVVRGEERYTGNKRTRDTVCPIGPELKYTLLQWLATRPWMGTGTPQPLFTTRSPHNGSYRRLLPNHIIEHLIYGFGVEFGFCAPRGDRDQTGVDVQFFRHFWTTQLTEAHGDHDDYLKPTLRNYIRGDTMEDKTLQTYTHQWDVRVREPYLDSIFMFGIGR